jgi:probable HAF family extracellular repeat protein
VVGASLTDTDVERAFLWTPSTSGGQSGTMQDLGTFGGNSWADAINSQGYVVGASQVANSPQPFLWRPTTANGTSGTMINLGGGDLGEALAINSSAVVVGTFTPSGTQKSDAALWQAGTNGAYTVSDLNSLIPTGTGWVLISADAINDRGQIVVEATQANGPDHALLLTPTTTTPALAQPASGVQTAASANTTTLLTIPPGNPATRLLVLSPQVPPFLGVSDASSVASPPTMAGNSSNPPGSARAPADAATMPVDGLDQVFAELDAGLSSPGWSKGLPFARRK